MSHGLKIVLGYDRFQLWQLLRVFRAKSPCGVSLILHRRLYPSYSVSWLVFLDFTSQLFGGPDCVNIFYLLTFSVVLVTLVTRALLAASKWITTFWARAFNIDQRYVARISNQLWLGIVRGLMFLLLFMIRLRLDLIIKLASLTRLVTVIVALVFFKTVNQTSIALFETWCPQWRDVFIFSQIITQWSTLVVDAV